MIQLLQLILFGIVQGATYALLAASFWLIYATTRTFHLAHSLTYAAAGYVTYVASAQFGLSLWIGGPLAVLGAAVVGCAMEWLLYQRLRARGAKVLGIFLASLGVAAAGEAGLQLIFGPQVKQVPGFPTMSVELSGITLTARQMSATLAAAMAIFVVYVFLTRTRTGHAITAVRTNPVMAMAVGIPIERISLVVFAVGSMMAGLAAFFETVGFVAYPAMGLQPILFGVIGVFLGGVASFRGAALGGFVLGFLIVFSGMFLSQNLGLILVFAVLLAVIVFRPEGLLRNPAAA